MIDISVKNLKSDITLDFKGHAGYAEHGFDIVCAGISALYCTLILALANIGEDIKTRGGLVTVKSAGKKAKIIIDTILVGIKGIQRAYPDYVNLAVDTREKTAQRKHFGMTPKNTFGNMALLQLFSNKGAKNAGFTDRRKKGDSERDTGARSENPEKPNDEQKEVFKVFNTKEDYQSHIDSIIGSRLKDDREQKSRLEKLQGLIEKLLAVFGAKDEDELIDTLSPAIDEVVKNGEEEKDYNDFVSMLESELKNAQGGLYAGQDARTLALDEDFLNLLSCGLDVGEALEIMGEVRNREDNIGESASEVRSAQDQSGAAARPAENALSATGAARISKNAGYLTDEELADIVKRVSKGEKIRF